LKANGLISSGAEWGGGVGGRDELFFRGLRPPG